MLPLYRSYLRAAALCLGGGVALVLLTRHVDAVDRSNADAQARARAHAVLLAAQAASLDSARTALVRVSTQTERTLVRYSVIRDSVFVPVTHADTVEVLARLPHFLAITDTLQHSCTDVVESCAVFRVRAESSLAGLTVDRDLYRDLYNSAKPSRFAAVTQWALRIGIAYGAFRLGQAAR